MVSDKEDKDLFYFDLTTATRSIQKHNITLDGGDMNARLGKKGARFGKKDARFGKKDARCFVYNDVTNEKGKIYWTTCKNTEWNHYILDTGNVKENYGHIHYHVARNHIDYILIKYKVEILH